MRFIALTLGLFLGACAGEPQVRLDDTVGLLRDELFAPIPANFARGDIFATDEAMRHYLKFDIASELRERGTLHGLVDALSRKDALKIDYDAGTTRTAAETFQARAGNCLSLVIMTAALARELKLDVEFQRVTVDPVWGRNGNLLIGSDHVNMVLRPGLGTRSSQAWLMQVVVDFLPPKDAARLPSERISQESVVAMYLNNRAAETLAQGRIDEAYAWAREAVRKDPGFRPALNTLGTVYLQHGNLASAQEVFRRILDRHPDNPEALSNLAIALQRSGDTAGAFRLRQRLSLLEPEPPFVFFLQGMQAMNAGDFARARELFAREVLRADYNAEFHFWLALADMRTGREAEAFDQLDLAMRTSITRSDHDRYSAKLDWLRSHVQ